MQSAKVPRRRFNVVGSQGQKGRQAVVEWSLPRQGLEQRGQSGLSPLSQVRKMLIAL